MEKKIDFELLTVIDESIDNSPSYADALDRVVEWQKQNRGLKGIHISTPLDVLCGTRKVEDPADEADKMAHDVLMMERARAMGFCNEVTAEELERM